MYSNLAFFYYTASSHNVFEAGLKELLLHHCYLWMSLVHISEHFLPFILEILIRDRAETKVHLKTPN